MRLALLLAALAGSAGVAGAAEVTPAHPTEGPGDTGLVLGLRAGWGVASGSFQRESAQIGDVVEWKVPLWLEVGYRFNPHVRGELYFELGVGSVTSEFCTAGASCSANDARFGLAVQLHFAPARLVDPWIGVGFGIEVLNAKLSGADPLAQNGRSDLTWAGLELPVEVGLDVALSDRFTIGPYFAASFGEFTSISQGPEGEERESGAVEDRAMHGWVQGGIKFTLKL